MQVFSLFDRKLREYGQLVQANNAEAVKRALVDGLKGSAASSLVALHGEDFDLMSIGFFDTDTGVFVPDKVPLLVVNVGTLIPPGESDGANGRNRNG